jgi:rubrerythrin
MEAFEFYNAAEKKVKSESLKSIFRELAAEEVKHKQLLEGYLKNDMQDLAFDESVDY